MMLSGILSAIVLFPTVTMSGIKGFLGKTMVRAPGQNLFISDSAKGFIIAALSTTSISETRMGRGFLPLLLALKTFSTALTERGFAPSPYTVSVGYITRSSFNSASTASLKREKFGFRGSTLNTFKVINTTEVLFSCHERDLRRGRYA